MDLTLAKVVRSQSGKNCAIIAGLYDAITFTLKKESAWITDGPVQTIWTTAKQVIVWTPKQAWKLTAREPITVPLPQCSFPVTTSSTVSSTGVLIGPADPTLFRSSGIPIEVVSWSGNDVFGCQ